jgi:hypothetical protein
MIRVLFQNGPDARAIELPEEFETKADATKRLPSLVEAYGTVPGAVAWLAGEKKPKAARRP